MINDYLLKNKIADVCISDPSIASRLSDCFGNIGFALSFRDQILLGGNKSSEKIDKLEKDYKLLVDEVLYLSTPEIIKALAENKPSKMGTNANILSIKKAFGIE